MDEVFLEPLQKIWYSRYGYDMRFWPMAMEIDFVRRKHHVVIQTRKNQKLLHCGPH